MNRLLLGVVLTSAVAFAQGPMGPGPMGPGPFGGGMPAPVTSFAEVKAYLGLTDDQVTKLQDLRRTEAQANHDKAQQIAEKYQALEKLMQQTQSSTAVELGTLLLDIKNLRTQLEQSRTTYHDQALAMLTDAQKPKLKSLEDAMKLQPTIGQAAALNLLLPPPPPAGGGMRFGQPGRGPQGRPFGPAARRMRAPQRQAL